MRTRPLWIALAIVLLARGVPAAPAERDLGQGLEYFRVHELPADLPPENLGSKRPCILDVRYVRGGRPAAAALLFWLKAHAGPRSPVFLLANSDTSPALLAPLYPGDAVPGLVILGPAAHDFEPDIALAVSPWAERRAYDAFEKGAPLDSLIHPKVDKVRDDEERLDKEHLPDSAAPPEQAADSAKPAAAAQLPPVDPVLQRAVQLHRSLLALKRL